MFTSNATEVKYSPADICEWFDISRTTLFRWEELGAIPRAERSARSERLYSTEHLKKLHTLVRSKIKDDLALSVRQNPDNLEVTGEMQERLYRIEFFACDDLADKEAALQQLRGLGQQQALSRQTIEGLARLALERPAGDRLRWKIWETLAHCERAAVQAS